MVLRVLHGVAGPIEGDVLVWIVGTHRSPQHICLRKQSCRATNIVGLRVQGCPVDQGGRLEGYCDIAKPLAFVDSDPWERKSVLYKIPVLHVLPSRGGCQLVGVVHVGGGVEGQS